MLVKLICAGLIILFSFVAFSLREVLQKKSTVTREDLEFRYTLPDEMLRLIASGYEIALGDVYWLRSLQNMDVRNQHRRRFSYLYHLLNVSSTLQPRYHPVYVGGGGFLQVIFWDYEGGEALFLKGLKEYPESIRILSFLALLYMTDLQDFQTAAHYLDLAGRVKGAPPWYRSLAARLYVEASRPDAALGILSALHHSEKNRKTRKELGRKMKLVLMEKQIMSLKVLKKKYESKFGFLKNLDLLVEKKMIDRISQDPFGGRFYLSEHGEIRTTSTEERFRPYIHERYRKKNEIN